MNSFVARCPTRTPPPPPNTHLSTGPTTKAAYRTGQDRTGLDLARRTKGRRILPLTSLEVSQVSCRGRQLAASALCLRRRRVCRRGGVGAKLALGSGGRGAAFNLREGRSGW